MTNLTLLVRERGYIVDWLLIYLLSMNKTCGFESNGTP